VIEIQGKANIGFGTTRQLIRRATEKNVLESNVLIVVGV
jgi:hypothetical protein